MECLREKFTGGLLLNGRYQTLSPLNHGSFGMVFMAQDLMTNQPVAIKCLTKSGATGSDAFGLAVDDSSEEFDLHSRLDSHHNIVNLLESFDTENHHYLVLEFCAQGDLYEAIRKGHGPLETEHVRQFMFELLDAVEYIHSKGVYHRDIKPENIFLTHDGTMKLGDFGLATTDKWSYEMMVGSDRYMAPEQFDSAGAGYSPASADLWAIGVCLLNILFSRNPFTTPTESDPLFLDFSRDRQSLFDVFPSMSQDTYEVIVECMNLDPRRRSIEGARDALLRVVSFTTDDESLDDFCCADKTTVASANREPLRTPSIQSPHIDNETAFPWTKALHATPRRPIRQLSVIPDESYSEDLFSKSEETVDWCSASVQTPSISSVLGASMNSLAISQPMVTRKVSHMSGSLPISMAKPLTLSASSVFGRRKDNGMSKSWSDMWEEDEEEEQREQQMTSLMELNARTWSDNKKAEADLEHTITGNVDDDLVDGFFFQEQAPAPKHHESTPRYSPPPKRTDFDKWSALGQRRRTQDSDKSPEITTPRRNLGIHHKSYEAGVFDQSAFNSKIWGRSRSKEGHSPWNKGRESNWRRDRRTDLADVEWVGGW